SKPTKCPYCGELMFDFLAHYQNKHPDKMNEPYGLGKGVGDAVREVAVTAGNQALGTGVLYKKPVPKKPKKPAESSPAPQNKALDRFDRIFRMVRDSNGTGITLEQIMQAENPANDNQLTSSIKAFMDHGVNQGWFKLIGKVYKPNFNTRG